MFDTGRGLARPSYPSMSMDMLRKLRAEADVYEATCMVVAEWDESGSMRIRHDVTPPDLAAGQFMAKLIERVLDATPVSVHMNVRQLYEHRSLPTEELADPELTDQG